MKVGGQWLTQRPAAFTGLEFIRVNDLFPTNTAKEAWYLRESLDQRITPFKFTPGGPANSKRHGLPAQPPKAVKRFIFNSALPPCSKRRKAKKPINPRKHRTS